MEFALILCTYMRPVSLVKLLESVVRQTLYPNQILIIDGSTNNETSVALERLDLEKMEYYLVKEEHRGLTRQRNYGINKTIDTIEVICFLDDDTILEPTYFENLLETYQKYPHALGVGGYITNEIAWKKAGGLKKARYFYCDNWRRNEPTRFRVRSWFGLQPDKPPCYLPTFSHGRSVSFLPPSNKIYPVELFMGGVSSYKKEVFQKLSFSSYFEGYGLYEDADFCLRLSKLGSLYVNTAARLEHHHDQLGRPNRIKYGKMVLRNGWYIWRVKYPSPDLKAKLKWHATGLLLTILTGLGGISRGDSELLKEFTGRAVGWWSLLIDKPRINY